MKITFTRHFGTDLSITMEADIKEMGNKNVFKMFSKLLFADNENEVIKT